MLELQQPLWLVLGLALGALSLADLARNWDAGWGRKLASVALRASLIIGLVVALAGPSWVQSSDRAVVIAVIDGSNSVGPEALERAWALIEREHAQVPAGADFGVVRVGDGVEVLLRPGESLRRPESLAASVGEGTDLAAGLHAALGLIPAHSSGRVLLLSDGRPTHGGLDAAIEAASVRGVAVHTVALEDTVLRSRIEELILDRDAVRPGEAVSGHVVLVAGDDGMSGTLVVRANEVEVKTELIELAAGARQTVLFTHGTDPLAEPGARTVVARLDTPSQSAVASYVIGSPPRVWVVADEEPEAEALRGALGAERIEVERLSASQASTRGAELDGVDLVILGNVPFAADKGPGVAPALAAGLRRYISHGGGLLTLGGDQAYELGHWGKSELAPALPIELEDDDERIEPAVNLLIVLDNSGSMNERVGSRTKMSLTNDAAVASMLLLRDKDRLGVMAVNTEIEWVVPNGELGERPALRQAIRGVHASGGGIYVYSALLEAERVLARSDTPLRHIILFSDARDAEEKVRGIPFGHGSGPSAFDVADRMNKAGITVSVIGMGERRDQDYAFLEQLADVGGGRFHVTSDASQLRALFAEETREVVNSLVHDDPLKVRQSAPHPALRELALDAAPPLLGYVDMRPRETATTSLTGPAGEPVLVSWQYGLGQVACFASDAGTAWSRRWVSWPGYGTFWTQLVRWSLRRAEGSDSAAELEGTAEHTTVRVVRRTAGVSDASQGLKLLLTRLDADESIEVPLRVDSPGRWVAQVNTSPRAPYGLQVIDAEGIVVVRQDVVAPASAEQAHQPADREQLATIAQRTGGQVRSEDGAATARAQVAGTVSTPLSGWLVLLVLLLLPLDAWLRRPARAA